MSNTARLLRWALKNGFEHKARVIAGHIIAGTELLGADIW